MPVAHKYDTACSHWYPLEECHRGDAMHRHGPQQLNGTTERCIASPPGRPCLIVCSQLVGLGMLVSFGLLSSPAVCWAKNHSPPKTIFSSPDTDADVVPTFVGKNGKPISAERDLKSPVLADILRLPSITPEQKTSIERIQKEMNLRASSLRERILTLEAKLDVVKGHPGELVLVGKPGLPPEPLPAITSIRTEIADVRKEIATTQQKAGKEAAALLTEKQQQQYEAMRHGELAIEGTDANVGPAMFSGDNFKTGNRNVFATMFKKVFRR